MWIRLCARRPEGPQVRLILLFLSSIRSFCLFLFVMVGLALSGRAYADEIIIAEVTINQQPKGQYFIVMQEDGDFLVLPEDLKEIGLRDLPAERVTFEEESYISLQNMPGLALAFDKETLTLALTADPQYLGTSTIDLGFTPQKNVYYPEEKSLFVNYGFDYTGNGDSSLNFQSFNFSNEVGFRFGEGLFLSDAIYTETLDENRWTRLNSQLIFDQRDRMRRFVIGDHIADSSDLGGRVPLGGFSFSKIYQIDPYFIRYPLFDFSGMLTLPSEVEFYVDGVRTRTERFAPGSFELENYQGVRGAQDITLVIRDSLGREQVIKTDIYATDQILRQGLQEYSYSLGFLRRNFGIESNNYDGNPAFSGYHLFGLTDWINLGGRAELTDGLINVGLKSILVAGSYGLVQVDGSVSENEGQSGSACQLLYEYRARHFNTRLGLQAYSSDYLTLADLENSVDRKINLFASVGYLTAELGSFGISYLKTQYRKTADRQELGLSWSRRLLKQTYLSASLAWVEEEETFMEGSVYLTWRLGRNHSLTASYQKEKNQDTQSLEARKDLPRGYGTGWRLEAERVETESNTAERLNGYIQHNARRAILRADVNHDRDDFNTNTGARVSLSGALVHVGGHFGLTRPVRDSFSLVSIGNAEKVQVYVSGQDMGRTNSQGKLFVPDLFSYYENRVSFEDKDIPIDYLMPQVELAVSPPFHSGSCVNFPLKRYQAFTGTLLTGTEGSFSPLTNAELVLQSPSGPVKFWTGGEGEFYLDSQMDELDILSVQGCAAAQDDSTSFLPAGTYPLHVKYDDQSFETEINIPASEEIFTELGAITLPILSGTALEVDSVPSQ